jgi:hypothetical protein
MRKKTNNKNMKVIYFEKINGNIGDKIKNEAKVVSLEIFILLKNLFFSSTNQSKKLSF